MGGGAFPRPHVLVVDDTPANLVAMRAILEPLDVDVVEAASGGEALARAEELSFALALIDVQMPQMDGFELARRLRATPNGNELPIIFVTAIHRDERFVREGYAAGAADYLTKPLEIDVVRARVRAFVDLFRQRERLRLLEVGERTRERDDALDRLGHLVQSERVARHDAELANYAKDEFVAMVSHELRRPLSAILGWSSMARKLPPGPDLARALETIERNAREQARLIEDLLDVSRGATGNLRLTLADVSVDTIVEAAAAALAPTAVEKGIDLVVEADAGTIRADAVRLKQIVSNLVSNSLKFTPEGGRVFVGARRHDTEVEIVVRDSGAGITPELLPLVFEPYRQAQGASSQRHEGLGLGLAIVKRLVEAHGGTISASSAGHDQGATFVVRLPESAHDGSQGADSQSRGLPASGTIRTKTA
ncbi:MAG TPA: hybrid sensor histidine kinase/response regulator [Polyangiaceae bacterium]|jgi:signal transduction histidine kinase